MEPGQYQLQIFVSLIVILGAAFVALICDFLKGNNEQLRELTIELQARQEEQRRAQMPADHSTEPETLTPVARQAATDHLTGPPGEEPSDSPEREDIPVVELGAEAASVPGASQTATTTSYPPDCRQANVQITAAAEAADEGSLRSSAQPVVVTVKPEVRLRTASGPVSAAAATAAVTAFAGRKRDWGSLLSRAAATAKSGTQHVELIQYIKPAETSHPLPAGFHDSYTLSQLVQSRRPVSGLVVSIGVNSTRKADGTNYAGVHKLIHSLIGPSDFACQASEQEFLLIYPQDRGASAQRRLSEIAQELWNFQLGSLGTRSIVFTWGGVEVRRETIDEAIASASERMHETRRGRKLLTMEPRSNMALRQAV